MALKCGSRRRCREQFERARCGISQTTLRAHADPCDVAARSVGSPRGSRHRLSAKATCPLRSSVEGGVVSVIVSSRCEGSLRTPPR